MMIVFRLGTREYFSGLFENLTDRKKPSRGTLILPDTCDTSSVPLIYPQLLQYRNYSPQHSRKSTSLHNLRDQSPGNLDKSCTLQGLKYSSRTEYYQDSWQGSSDWKTIHSCSSVVSSEGTLLRKV